MRDTRSRQEIVEEIRAARERSRIREEESRQRRADAARLFLRSVGETDEQSGEQTDEQRVERAKHLILSTSDARERRRLIRDNIDVF